MQFADSIRGTGSMRDRLRALLTSLMFSIVGHGAFAAACDYKPSRVIGQTATTTITSGAGAITAGAIGLKAAGIYTLVHSTSGLTMLGSTLAGSSAAGTIGIVGGTGGAIGTAGAILSAPVTIIVAGAAVAVMGGFEGVCYFQVERVTDYDEVVSWIRSVEKIPGVSGFRYEDYPNQTSVLHVADPETSSVATYMVSNLYVADGALISRDWGRNTKIVELRTLVSPVK